jgi:hypothetical protein
VEVRFGHGTGTTIAIMTVDRVVRYKDWDHDEWRWRHRHRDWDVFWRTVVCHD